MKRAHHPTLFSLGGAAAAWGVSLGCLAGAAHAADAPATTPPAPSASGADRSVVAAPRFEVLANGEEVLDRQAKLIWRRCVEGMRWTGTTCWGVAARLDFAAAQAHAAKQAKESGKPWRLPHVPEMRLIVQKPAEPIITSGIDRGKRAAWVDPQWSPATPAEWHWTQSTTVLGGNVNIYNYANIVSGTTTQHRQPALPPHRLGLEFRHRRARRGRQSPKHLGGASGQERLTIIFEFCLRRPGLLVIVWGRPMAGGPAQQGSGFGFIEAARAGPCRGEARRPLLERSHRASGLLENPVSPAFPPALIALADGTVLMGQSIGAPGQTVGEVVFNTAITGYQEILTDPSYCQQIVTLTYPHIGNYGVNPEDVESSRVHAAGLVVKDLPLLASNHRCTQSLSDYLRREGTVAIAGVDTRALTRRLRTHGAQNGCILALSEGEAVTDEAKARAVAAARAAPSMAGQDLARVVSTAAPYEWTETEWTPGQGYGQLAQPRWHVVAYDFGVKRNILRMLAARGCRVSVVPAQTPAAEVLAAKPDGVFLSNGPGDPEPCDYAIAAAAQIMEAGIPTFGICLGHQIMALASGAKTFKMKFGHHGANHPVKDLDTGRVSITSQNHGFAVDADSLPANLRPTHVSLFDGTLQGLARTDKPAFCFQGHPEASPGPHDMAYLFDRFIGLMAQAR